MGVQHVCARRRIVIIMALLCILVGTPADRAHGCVECPWDLDESGTVGITDFLDLLALWGTDPGGPPDFDGGGVGITDFLELLANWGLCPDGFDPLTTLTHGPDSIVQAFWSQETTNLLCVGDSIMNNGSPARLYDAILRSWDIPAGWRGFHATTAGNSGVRRWLGWVSGYDGVDASRVVRSVTQPSFGGTHFYGLPHQHLEHDVGIGFQNEELGCRIERAQLRLSGFDLGTVSEWYTGNPITAQVMYLYNSAPAAGEAYTADVNVGVGAGIGALDGGPWRYASDFTPQHGLSDIATGGPGLNLINRKHPIPTDDGPDFMRLTLRCTDNWELSQQLWCMHLGVKVDGGPGGVIAGILAENSWDSDAWVPDAPADAATKQFTNNELDRYLDLMYDDKTSPLYIVIVEGPENTPLDEYVANNHARNDRFQAAWQRVGGSEVRFIYIGIYRTGDDALACNNNEAFFRTADQRSDTYFVSLYGLLGGILWDNSDTGGDQSAYAEAQGWDAIEINDGVLDMSNRHALDAAARHPANEPAAFFFACVAAEKIRHMNGN
ncbi:MAG: hypothetical protein ACYTGF_09505 [Planctomycetota bacterium]|jgi:hypothetical protein